MRDVSSTMELSRDCKAVQVPVGNVVLLPAGTEVTLQQSLGGTFTVQALGGLFRISGEDADALGVEKEASPATGPVSGQSGPVDEHQVWLALRSCYDPEIPVNIVDLGLIYDLAIEPSSTGSGAKVSVKMTLTAPGCGMGTVIAGDAQQKILALPGVSEASVDVVWDPPWHQSMITAEGRQILGL